MRHRILILIFFIAPLLLQAQFPSLDPSFNEYNYDTFNEDITIQPDGKILVFEPGRLYRLEKDGGIDNTFGLNGEVIFSEPNFLTERPVGIFIQNDGKIILAHITGSNRFRSETHIQLIRLTQDGAIDNEFGENGYVSYEIPFDYTGMTDFEDLPIKPFQFRDLEFQSDGKIVVAGNSTIPTGEATPPDFITTPWDTFSAFRFNTDGSLDTSFGEGGNLLMPIHLDPEFQISGYLSDMEIQADDKIILGGTGYYWLPEPGFPTFLPLTKHAIVRLEPNGTIDTNFNDGKTVLQALNPNGGWGWIGNLLIQDEEKIILTSRYDPESYRPDKNTQVIRLNNDGSLDKTFGEEGILNLPIASDFIWYYSEDVLEELPNGDLFIFQNRVAAHLIKPDGTIDTEFGEEGIFSVPINTLGQSIALQNGNLILADWEAKKIRRYILASPEKELVEVNRFTLYDASTNEELYELEDGAEINLRDIGTNEINIRAYTEPEPTGSVRFNLTGTQTYNHIENNSFYALFANKGDNFFSWKPALGDYQLSATPFPESNARGAAGTPLSISFSIIDEEVSEPLMVERFTLINAITDEELYELEDGQIINLQEIGTDEINIRAYTNPEPTGSVRFNLTGAQTYDHIEKNSYYALYANKGDDFFSWKPSPGQYRLVATPYTEAGGSGEQGEDLSISFEIVDGQNDEVLRTANVYPNPGTNILYIPLKENHEKIKFKMFDSRGKQVKITLNHINDILEIDVTGLEKNTYIIQIISDNNVLNLRWLKE